jgi:putative acyl-CoA dehydrogenase
MKAGATMGMAMTEKQGGSDVRANTTRALGVAGDEAELVGHKWFCSAPMSDAFMTLAYEDAGLSCFLVPRWRPDGERNAIEIQRLKDKLGDRSNASSEIEYKGAWARRVGEAGRGVATILQMVQLTRYDCVLGTAGMMRRALTEAIWHVGHRTAFQKMLIDQPLMRATLADVAVEVEAAMALAWRLGEALDEGDVRFARLAIPAAKYWVTKRCPPSSANASRPTAGPDTWRRGRCRASSVNRRSTPSGRARAMSSPSMCRGLLAASLKSWKGSGPNSPRSPVSIRRSTPMPRR